MVHDNNPDGGGNNNGWSTPVQTDGFNDPSCYRPDSNELVSPITCVTQEEPLCAWIDPPSIELWEYLPFWRDLEFNDSIDEDAATCNDVRSWMNIPWWSLSCNFSITNGSGDEWEINGVPCLESDWENSAWETYPLFSTAYFDEFSKQARGKSFVQLIQNQQDATTNKSLVVWDTLGEHQIALNSIDYDVCTSTWPEQKVYTRSSDQRICAMNFSVTDWFYMYKWPALYSPTNMSLERYKNLAGWEIISQAFLNRITWTSEWSFESGRITTLIDDLLAQYAQDAAGQFNLTSEHTLYRLDLNTWIYKQALLKKVANKEVYVYDGIDPLVIAPSTPNQTPFTLIVSQADMMVQWSLTANAMFVVPNWRVVFENLDCNEDDRVQWIFIAGEWFNSPTIENNVLENNRCDGWWLSIVGALLSGEWFESELSQERRSVIDSWFNITNGTQEEKIFDAASVIFEADASSWSFSPPGIDIIQESIRVIK